MALIYPHAPGSASVIAACDSVVARITEAEFSKLANRFPRLWRRIASGLAAHFVAREPRRAIGEDAWLEADIGAREMIELESYMAPVPMLHRTRGAQVCVTRRTVVSRPSKLKSIKSLRRRSSRKRGSRLLSWLTYLI
jgi:CRP-like cAMP-binding protein